MPPRIVVIVEPQGVVRVLSNSLDIQVLVLDPDVEGTEGHITVDGQPVAVDSLLEGLPQVDPSRVAAVFDEVHSKLAEAAAVPGVGVRGRAQLTQLQKSWPLA